MGKNDRDWIPEGVDLDWIESLARPPAAALLAIEEAAEPLGIPIVDRDAGRVLSVLAAGTILAAGLYFGAGLLV
ncbi:MAG: hypothetical protein ACJ77C_01630 [Chloroflexota bacterium]